MTASIALGDFADAFAAALLGRPPPHGVDLDALAAQPGFRVYRNTVMKGCVDALAANFPAVLAVVGEEWFRAAARIYAAANLPTTPMLVEYGATFPAFLAAFEPAQALPYLADVAALDRLWTEAHVAADAAPLDAARLTALAPERVASARLVPHPSARWRWFADAPIFSIWRGNRDASHARDLETLDWRGEGVLLVRPRGAVEARAIDAASCAFIDACARGACAADALSAAAAIDASAPLDALVATLLAADVFSTLDSGE